MISLTHLHPMLVHFPIALVVFGFAVEFASLIFKKEVCLSKAGFYLLLGGTLSALFALLAGVFLTSEMSGTAGEVKDTHEIFAWITLVILTLTSLLRIFILVKHKENTNLKWVAFVLYALAFISVGLTGLYGGTLVYNYMMPL